MGRVIKLFIYYLLYTFAFSGIFAGGYMIAIAFHLGGRRPPAGLEICKARPAILKFPQYG